MPKAGEIAYAEICTAATNLRADKWQVYYEDGTYVGATIPPSAMPSSIPTIAPSSLPSTIPSSVPSSYPTVSPSLVPSSVPTSFSENADRAAGEQLCASILTTSLLAATIAFAILF
jgi:hypothetical protein